MHEQRRDHDIAEWKRLCRGTEFSEGKLHG